jgi:hypothetical protein
MYSDEYPPCARCYASLGIYHATLNPEAISSLLGIQPTKSWQRGEIRNPRSRNSAPSKFGGWVLRTRGVVESRDVRRHIDWLIDQVQMRGEVFRSLQAEGYRTGIRCFWMAATENGGRGPTLSPVSMVRMAALGLELSFDFYFSAEEDLPQSNRPEECVSN